MVRVTTERRVHYTESATCLKLVDRFRFPDAWIQAGRLAGTDKAAILDHVRLDMHPVQAIEEAVSFVEKHSVRVAVMGRLRRRDR